MPSTNELFPIVKPGDPIKADDWNLIAKQIAAMSGMGDHVNALFTGAGTFIRTVKTKNFGSVYVELNEELSAAASFGGVPTEAAADVLKRDPDYGNLTDTNFGITVVNRTDQVFPYGYQCRATWTDGEWLVDHGSCPD